MGSSFSDGINEVVREALRDVNRALEEVGITPDEMGGGMSDVDDSAEGPIERELEVGPGAELAVSNISGEIVIRSGPAGRVRVRGTKRGSPSRAAHTQIQISKDDNRVTVNTRGASSGLLSLGRSMGRVDYFITVPRDCSVRVHTVSGEVDVQDIDASVSVESVSGDTVVRNVHGDLSATTVSGDLDIRDVMGALVVRTTSGDVEVRSARLRRFNLNSVSGDFSIETPLVAGEHYFAKTVSGDLHLTIPRTTGAMIQLRTTSGDVTCDLPAEIIRSGRRHWQGRINGGGATVEMNSVSGDLTIAPGAGSVVDAPDAEIVPPIPHVEPDTPPADPGAPAEPEPSSIGEENRTTAILRLLEQGEITVDEALARLEQR